MPRLYPQTVDSSAPSSERRIFHLLRDTLPDDWIVIHSLRINRASARPGESSRYEGEADFVILDPRRGFLVLEVKGGEVRRDGHDWTSVDRNGEMFSIKDPVAQAQAATRACLAFLQTHAPFPRESFQLGNGWGVAFPDVEVTGSLGSDLPRVRILDHNDLQRDPLAAIDRLFDAAGVRGDTFTRPKSEAFVQAMLPTARLVPSLKCRIDDDEKELLRLTDEQATILEAFSESKRLRVKGPAGSGKTLLAMRRASELADSGKRVLLLCFNRPLADYLALRAKGFQVMNFHHFCRTEAEAAGLKFKPPGVDNTEFWENVAPSLLVEALEKRPARRWDAVIVDEAQDFQEMWWLAIEKLYASDESDLWIFYDPYQDIYGGAAIESLGLQPAVLRTNCRNTKRIAEYAFGLVQETPVLRDGTPEGEPVQILTCADEAAMLDAVRRALHELVNEQRISVNRVVILTPVSLAKSVVHQAGRIGSFTILEYPLGGNGSDISIATLQRYKGLEADAIILCEVRRQSDSATPRHLYVAASRAKHVLKVLRYV